MGSQSFLFTAAIHFLLLSGSWGKRENLCPQPLKYLLEHPTAQQLLTITEEASLSVALYYFVLAPERYCHSKWRPEVLLRHPHTEILNTS